MRESISTTTIFQLVLIFTFIFAGFISVAIVYNRVIRLKNQSIKIIEKYEGMNDSAITVLNNYLKNNGYSTKDSCESNEYGATSLESVSFEPAESNGKYYYCVSSYCNSYNSSCTTNDYIYYNIKLFFRFNLPVIGDIFTFRIKGETKAIRYYGPVQRIS